MKNIQPQDHNSLTDDRLLRALETGKLSPRLFTHEAHLRWGWLLLQKYGKEKARNQACGLLRNYTKALGVPEKYNETVTVAAIYAIGHFRKKSKARNFGAFLEENPRLVTSFKELMEAHYSADIFNSDEARKSYKDPDLRPFD